MGKECGGSRILLVDDNRQGLLARKIILEDLGYDVETAETGEAGLACFRACAADAPFNLVITDYRMPGMRGDEVIEQLRQLTPSVPVVMLSGYAGTLALTPESTGADVVLSKGPREQYDLAETVVRLLPDGAQRRGKPPAMEQYSAVGVRLPPRRRTRAG